MTYLGLKAKVETAQMAFNNAATNWDELKEKETAIQMQILDAKEVYYLANLKLKEAELELAKFVIDNK